DLDHCGGCGGQRNRDKQGTAEGGCHDDDPLADEMCESGFADQNASPSEMSGGGSQAVTGPVIMLLRAATRSSRSLRSPRVSTFRRSTGSVFDVLRFSRQSGKLMEIPSSRSISTASAVKAAST